MSSQSLGNGSLFKTVIGSHSGVTRSPGSNGAKSASQHTWAAPVTARSAAAPHSVVRTTEAHSLPVSEPPATEHHQPPVPPPGVDNHFPIADAVASMPEVFLMLRCEQRAYIFVCLLAAGAY